MRPNIRCDTDDLMVAQVLRRCAINDRNEERAAQEEADAALEAVIYFLILCVTLTLIALIAAEQAGWWGGPHASDVRNAEHQDRQGGTAHPQRDSSGPDYSIQS